MINKQTVFVIGAGGGADIDMCVGDKLMKIIASEVDISFAGGGYRKVRGNDEIVEALKRVAREDKIDLNTLCAAGRQIAQGVTTAGSIDNYIHHHTSNNEIKIVAKIAIVKTILQYERASKVFIDHAKNPKLFRDSSGLERSWLHSFFRILGDGIVVGKTLDQIFDSIAVINFNYDRCFEQYLWLALQYRFSINPDTASTLIGKLRIHHPYGKIAPLPWQDRGSGVHLGGHPHGEVDLYGLSKNIKTYNEEVDKGEELNDARKWIDAALRVVFLGFHFHDQNVELIKTATKSAHGSVKQGFATVFERHLQEQKIIREQITDIMSSPSNIVTVHLEPVECRRLFEVFGTTFTH